MTPAPPPVPGTCTPFPELPTRGCVVVRLRYLHNRHGGLTPWKWHGRCICGWNVLSWDWERTVGHVDNHLKDALNLEHAAATG